MKDPIPLDERLEAVRSGRSVALDLSRRAIGKELKRIPDAVFGLANLEELVLYEQSIRTIPDRIRELPKLRLLDIRRTPVKNAPNVPGLKLDWPTYLASIRSLSPENVVGMKVSFGRDQEQLNSIAEPQLLPAELLKLPCLRSLTIGTDAIIIKSNNKPGPPLPAPPAEIEPVLQMLGKLTELRDLVLIGAEFRQIPSGVRKLQRLVSLYISGLHETPPWLDELSALESLSFSNNKLTEIPEAIFALKELRRLDLPVWFDGQIKAIPEAIVGLPNLQHVEFDGHPIETPPPEVVSNGVEAIKDYWRQRRDVGIDYLCEAKILIVGEGGAGKTSLASKLVDRSYVLKPGEPSTEGIKIGRWSFPFGLRINEDGAEKLLSHRFTANLWDFGGQEIYHATHQFFLSRRSLYILVTDDRKEDTDFHYWLQVVELLGGDSPLLIVQNEKQNRRRDVDLPTLRSRFSILKQNYRVNLADNRGLDALQSAIRKELESLPHIGTALPRTWISVRQALEKDSRNYISADDYFALCDTHGFKRLADKLQLSSYLHDLGICLHFQEDPLLKNTLFLNPNWATDAVYRVLDDNAIENAQGRFHRNDLFRIWPGSDFSPVRDELVRLMINFRLCYELPSGTEFIAPQLLSLAKPDYPFEESGSLVVRYVYDFLPKGVIVSAIVSLHHLIADHRLVWRRGAVLERFGTHAEISEDYVRQTITVRVSGADARGLLAIIDDQLSRIHATFPKLTVDRHLPCRCEVCRARPEPFAFAFSELKDFARTDDGIQCRVSRKLVNARELIRDVLPGAFDRTRTEISEVGSPHGEKEAEKAVFVSYSWAHGSIVDEIEQVLSGSNITLIRDRNELKYRDSIRSFMRRLGHGKAIIIILSQSYLESKNCMFELTEIAEDGDLRARVFPIVLPDAGIFDAVGRIRYIKYWEAKKKELDDELRSVGGEHLEGIREEIDLYAKIRRTIARLTDILGDMNVLSLEQHRKTAFADVIKALE